MRLQISFAHFKHDCIYIFGNTLTQRDIERGREVREHLVISHKIENEVIEKC